MALECNMIKDIRKYETKVFGPFTKRQMICLLIGILYAVPIVIFLPFDWMDKILIGAALASPAFLCGYIKIDGTPPEIYVIRYIYKVYLAPSKRKWKNANPYEAELKKIKMQRGEIVDKKKIKYSNKADFKIYK